MFQADRRTVLAVALLAVTAVATVLLQRVLSTVFFAITISYVLYPLKRELERRGLERHLTAATCTLVAFGAATLLVAPVVYVLYRRRGELLLLIRNLPAEVPISAFDFTYVVSLGEIGAVARDAVVDLAVEWAGAAPVLALKAFLFAFLVYAVLLRPGSVRGAVFGLVPGSYHDVVRSLHRRVRSTLFAIYVLQAATAFGTFVLAVVVFGALGYEQVLTLAVLAGILQFVPVVGPSVLVVGLAASDLMAGDVTAAVLVVVLGLLFVGFLPDVLIRPRLAAMTAEMPASLYFVGFTGGVLSLGIIGFIAGPLVVGLLVEFVELASASHLDQKTLD